MSLRSLFAVALVIAVVLPVGFEPGPSAPVASAAPVPTRDVVVTVVDPDGKPVEGVTVIAVQPIQGALAQTLARPSDAYAATATTGADGTARLTGVRLRSPMVQLHARTEGRLPTDVALWTGDLPAGDAAIARTIRLRNPTVVTGRVLRGNGEPWANASIRIRHAQFFVEAYEPPGSPFVVPPLHTDEAGRFEATLPQGGGYIVVGPGRRDAAGATVWPRRAVWSRGDERIDVEFARPSSALRVTLAIDWAGTPPAERVELLRIDAGLGYRHVEAPVDENGCAAFMAEPGESWMLAPAVEPDALFIRPVPGAQRVTIPAPATGETSVRIAVRAPVGAVRVDLRGPDGDAIDLSDGQNWMLLAKPAAPTDRLDDGIDRLLGIVGVASVEPTARKPEPVLRGLAPGDYDVWAVPIRPVSVWTPMTELSGAAIGRGRVTIPVDATPDEPIDLTIRTAEPAGVRLRLTRGFFGGNPVWRSHLALHDGDGREIPPTNFTMLGIIALPTAADIGLTNFAAGRSTTVVAHQPGTGLSYAMATVTPEAGKWARVTLTPEPARTLRLRVVDGDGEPVAGARWRITNEAGIDVTPTGDTISAALGIGPNRPTDADGRVEISGLRGGTYRVAIETADGAVARTEADVTTDGGAAEAVATVRGR
jgi:hypothetical protein